MKSFNLAAWFACGILIAISVVMLHLYSMMQGPDKVLLISANQYGEFWPEVGLFLVCIALGIAGMWTVWRDYDESN
jgi:succinate dehydrogenase hydrophobic anchor subunit